MLGEFLEIYKASSTLQMLDTKTSGRIVTTLILYSFRKKIYEKALVTRMSRTKPWFAEPVIAHSEEEVIAAAGSKYIFVPQKKLYNQVDEKTIVVGLPCQLARVPQNALKIGLFCGINSSMDKLNYIFRKKRISKNDIRKLDHRDSKGSRLRIELKNGRVFFMKVAGLNYFFSYPMCKVCTDFSAHHSDITVGDYDFQGTSVVLVRSQKGRDLLRRCIEDTYIHAERITMTELLNHRTSSLLQKEMNHGYANSFFIGRRWKNINRIPLPLLNCAGKCVAVYYKHCKGRLLLKKFQRGEWKTEEAPPPTF